MGFQRMGSLFNGLVFFADNDAFAFVIAAFRTGVMGKLCFSAFGASAHGRGAGFFVGPPFVPF
jgi:hypothetical protein